jgi:modulator of FtsH protease
MNTNNSTFQFSADALHSAGIARLEYIRRVYSYFGLGLLTAAGGALLAMNTSLVLTVAAHPIISIIAFFVTFFFAAASANKPQRALPAMLLFTTVNGAMLSPLLFAIAQGYVDGTGPGLIYNALFLTILIFAGLTAYVFVSKKDFSYLGATLTIGLFLVFGAMLVNLFVSSSSLDLALSIVIVILFSGFILVDTSRILKRSHEVPPTLAALSLYLDFINIFLALLRILGGRRD